jgi:hypothetical protein
MTPARFAVRVILGCLLSLSALAGDTYRWTDEKGAVHYSDKVPPEQAKNRRSKLNARGFEVEVVDAPKTARQIEQEKLLGQLRAQQEKVLNEQRDQDRALMRTYRNTDEILAALRVKLDSLESVIKLAQARIERDAEAVAAQEKKASELTQKGQAVPAVTQEAIAVLNRRIASHREQIARTENEKLATADRYNHDLKRFAAIKSMQDRKESFNVDWTRGVAKSMASGDSDIIISVAECRDKASCDRSWDLARSYLSDTLGYRLSVETEKILQTPYPRSETDFGITITRFPGKGNVFIFMDVICRPTSIGEQLCRSARVREIHGQFRRALDSVSETAAIPAPSR